MREIIRTEEISTKEAMIAYDNSIKRLQSMLTIEGVILALLIPSMIELKDPVPQLCLIVSSMILSSGLMVTSYGLFHKRMVKTIVDTASFIAAGGEDPLRFLQYKYRNHKEIQKEHG